MRHPLFTAAILVLLAIVFHRAASAPIALVDTWSHWKYGGWIWEQKRLPEREPLDPAFTDQAKPFVDTAWLGEVIGYQVLARGGTQGISLAAALVDVLKTLLLLLTFQRISGSPWLALLGTVLVQLGLWTNAGMFRPQLLAELCGAAVLLAAGSKQLAADSKQQTVDRVRDRSVLSLPSACFLLPALFVLWANLDASFLVGLAWVALLLIGRMLEGKSVGRLALTVGLCAAAVCVNPYGPRLVSAAIADTRVHLQFAGDWQPPVSPRLPQLSFAAWVYAASVLLVLVTLRLSPKRFSPADVLLLLVFGVATWFIGRLLPWWLMVWGWVLLPHWKAVGDKETRRQGDKETSPILLVSLSPCLLVSFSTLAIAGVLVLDAVRLSGREQLGTPIELANQLDEVLSRRPARVFAPLYWSDYLLWRLPATGQLFLYNRFEVFRVQQLLHYDRILTMRTGPDDWRTLLNRAGIGVVVLSANGPGKDLFAHFLQNSESGWQLAYVNNDATELIAVREP